MYLSDHPLKKFEFELDTFTSCKLSEVDDIIAECNKTKTMRKLNLAGLITSVETKQSKTGRPYAKIIVEDFSGSRDFVFFGGLTKAGDLLMKPLKESYDNAVLPIFKGKAKFLVSTLDGSSAAVLGASAVGWDL